MRAALATQAYAAGRVRLAEPDLGAATHLVATRQGLFAATATACRLVAHGFFYGIAVDGDDFYAFEAGDRPRAPTRRGRLVRFRRRGTTIVATTVIAAGLDNGCHGLDLIDGRLHLIDTYNQRLLRVAREGGEVTASAPIPMAGAGDWAGGYVHANSILARGDERLLLCHNGAERTGRTSEVAVFDRDWRRLRTEPLAGMGCHSLALLADGTLLSCGSMAGELIGSNGLRVPLGDMMTRGLAVGEDEIVVGGTPFADRWRREEGRGVLYVLDRDYRLHATLPVPASPTEVRRLDGRDRSLSAFVAAATRGAA